MFLLKLKHTINKKTILIVLSTPIKFIKNELQ